MAEAARKKPLAAKTRLKLCRSALAHARETGWRSVVVVVAPDGTLRVAASSDGADQPASVNSAQSEEDKAFEEWLENHREGSP